MLFVAVLVVAGLAGVTSLVLADDAPTNPGHAGDAGHGPPPAESELMLASAQTLASLAYIDDPTIKCGGGPCLGGSREDVIRAVTERCEKVGTRAFTTANASRSKDDPGIRLDAALAAACVSIAAGPPENPGRAAAAARSHLGPLSEAFQRAQAAVVPKAVP